MHIYINEYGIKIRLSNNRLLAKMNAELRYAAVKETIDTLSAAKQKCSGASISVLRGIEGVASRCYFSAIELFIDDKFGFSGRNRRPPKDPANAALSYSYTLLYNHIDTILRSKGFDTFEGIIHTLSNGHRALASDIMESFRSYTSDYIVIDFLKNADIDSDFNCVKEAVYLSNMGMCKMIKLTRCAA